MIIPAPVPRAWNNPPQKQEGPCTIVCGHGHCQRLIQRAESCCVLCNQRIGYNASYVELYDGQLFHVVCPPRLRPPPHMTWFDKLMRRAAKFVRPPNV